MKIPRLLRRKKLRATTAARRSLRASAEMGYDEMEPNMKLSRALLIVLVLHVVAVSGIIAFNAIKTRQAPFVSSVAPSTSTSTVVPAPATTKPEKQMIAVENAKPAHSPAKSIAKDEHKTDHLKAATANHASAPADSGKVYVVAKGDNPVAIAKKLKVGYDDLLQLNHIDDPRKLQIGTKLLIPKTAKGKKTDE
jgi:LysM repeat protein